MCQSGKYHTVTPRAVRMLQNVNCRDSKLHAHVRHQINLRLDTRPQQRQTSLTRRSEYRRLDRLVYSSLSPAQHRRLVSCPYQLAPLVHIFAEPLTARTPRTSYFGSQCTYPLARPFTSFTTSSKLLKSIAVTASKPTSRRTRAHSKKAYMVYADHHQNEDKQYMRQVNLTYHQRLGAPCVG